MAVQTHVLINPTRAQPRWACSALKVALLPSPPSIFHPLPSQLFTFEMEQITSPLALPRSSSKTTVSSGSSESAGSVTKR